MATYEQYERFVGMLDVMLGIKTTGVSERSHLFDFVKSSEDIERVQQACQKYYGKRLKVSNDSDLTLETILNFLHQ